jgi:hypothetical protein
VSDGDGGPRFGAPELARLAVDVQGLGFDAARIVVDRFSELFEYFRQANGPGGAADGDRSRRVEADAERLFASYISLLNDMGPSPSARGPAPSTDGALALPDIAPGGRTSARLWLHNTTASTAGALRPWAPGLAASEGSALPGDALTFLPPVVDRLSPGESHEIVAVLAVPEGAALGTYHGLVLVEHLPDTALPVRVHVVPGASVA